MKRIPIILHLSAFLMVSYFTSISAHGQDYQSFSLEIYQIKEKAKLRFGPFLIFPKIYFRNIGYDDNVYFQREEENPASDFTGALSPEVKVYLLFRNYLILSFTENPEYVYYVKEKSERKFNNTLAPSLRLKFLNRFIISGSYSSSDRRVQASSEFDIRTNEKVKMYSGRLFYETDRMTSFGFFGSVRKINYEDITYLGEEIWLSQALNREEKSGYFEFYYRAFSESFLFLGAGYTEYKFEHAETIKRDSTSYQILSGIRFPLLGSLKGTFSLGYKKLIPKAEGKKSFSGIISNTKLDFRKGRFSFRLDYTRDNPFSYSDNIYFVEDRYAGGISFYVTRFFRVDYNLIYGENNYPEPIEFQMQGGGIEKIKRRDIFHMQTFGFVFRLIRDTGLGLMLNLWERSSNYPSENRKRMFIGGYITYEF